MEIYIGIGFIVLCCSVLIGIIGIYGYTIKLTKKELDVAPKNNTTSSQTNNMD